MEEEFDNQDLILDNPPVPWEESYALLPGFLKVILFIVEGLVILGLVLFFSQIKGGA